MGAGSDDLELAWLTRRTEWITRYANRHRVLTDATLALTTAVASLAGLMVQGRATPAMLTFDVLLCAPLLLRHRSVLTAFGGVAAVALAQWLISGPQLADAAVLIALYWVCLDGGLRSVAIALAISEAGAVMLALGWEQQRLRYWVGVSGLVVAAAALGVIIRQRRALLASLQERAARLERERDQQGLLGAAAERARIAREMHDIVSHNLTVMIALADGARYTLDDAPERAGGAVERISTTGRQALVEMRRLLGVLRDDSVQQSLEPQPSLERLEDLLARVDAAGVPVELELVGDPRELAAGVQLAVFRVAQEALTNTLKHAQRPTSARLALTCRAGRVELDVTNTGGPLAAGGRLRRDQASDGRGLRGMRERATAYGGELEAGPTPDGGWRVHLRLASDGAGAPRLAEARR